MIKLKLKRERERELKGGKLVTEGRRSSSQVCFLDSGESEFYYELCCVFCLDAVENGMKNESSCLFNHVKSHFFASFSIFYLHSVTKVQSISSFLILIIFLYFNVSYCNYSIRICVPYSRYNKHVTPFLSLLSDSY